MMSLARAAEVQADRGEVCVWVVSLHDKVFYSLLHHKTTCLTQAGGTLAACKDQWILHAEILNELKLLTSVKSARTSTWIHKNLQLNERIHL